MNLNVAVLRCIALIRRFQEWLPSAGLDVVTFGFSLGRKPKGDTDRNRLPFDSHCPFLRLTYGSSRCHSCRNLSDLAEVRHAHNPKVEGSNPSTATNSFNNLRATEYIKVRPTPINPLNLLRRPFFRP